MPTSGSVPEGTQAVALAPPRTLGFASLVGITFFCVAGGAYGLEDAVGAAGPAWALLAILVVPWVWSLPMALMTAELTAAMPEDGGFVVWVERAFGRFWGFQEGWWSWLCSFADNALYPVMFAEYLRFWFPRMTPVQFWLVCLAMIGIVACLNVRGAQVIGFSSVLFTLLVLAPFAVMVLLGMPHLKPSVWFLQQSTAGRPEIWSTLLSVMLWNYSGWDNAGCCGGEVNEPHRTYPRAMVTVVAIVLMAYLLPVAVGVSGSQDWSKWKAGYFPEVAQQIGGAGLGAWLALGGLVSAMGLFSALLLTSSRVPYAMAMRRMLPAPLARLHPRYGTPWATILLNSIGCTLLIGWASQAEHETGTFVALLKIDMWMYALALILEFAALIYLRIREPDMHRPYRIPGGVAGLALLSGPPVLLCAVSMVLCPRPTQMLGIAGVVAGCLLYYGGGVRARR
jgi:amino acid transporter